MKDTGTIYTEASAYLRVEQARELFVEGMVIPVVIYAAKHCCGLKSLRLSSCEISGRGDCGTLNFFTVALS